MSEHKAKLMTKAELAQGLGLSEDDICKWGHFFADWLDVCPTHVNKMHDRDDAQIFALINQIVNQVQNFPFNQQIEYIKQNLYQVPVAKIIRERRRQEKAQPEFERWRVVNTNGVCLKYDYKWLTPLQESVETLVDFGCWATNGGTCFEPYALLWTLQAKRVTVIDNNPDYIQNALSWLETHRKQYPYFKDYDLEFLEGDLTTNISTLHTDFFDLAYCKNVLYYMDDDMKSLQSAINEMVRTVKSGGWLIVVEPKFKAKFEEQELGIGSKATMPVQVSEPEDMSEYFHFAGLIKKNLEDAPPYSYCYQKP